MNYSKFEEICYYQFCYCCKYNHEHCFPFCSMCPEQDNIQKIYNSCYSADCAFDYDDDTTVIPFWEATYD